MWNLTKPRRSAVSQSIYDLLIFQMRERVENREICFTRSVLFETLATQNANFRTELFEKGFDNVRPRIIAVRSAICASSALGAESRARVWADAAEKSVRRSARGALSRSAFRSDRQSRACTR